MPFLGRDSTGPGHQWVRTGTGWKRAGDVAGQVNRQIKKFARSRIAAYSKSERHGSLPEERPSTSQDIHDQAGQDKLPGDFLFLPSAWRSSRQRGTFLTVGNIFNSFDLCSAVRDHRRFNYVCKILEIICDKHFGSLSGSAIKALFSILEEVVDIVRDTQQPIRRVIKLLETVRSKMSLYSSRLIGSRLLYTCRSHLLSLWLKQLQDIQLYEREEDGEMMLLDLPLDCLEHLFRFFANPRDVVHLCQTCHTLDYIGSNPILWEELFEYHFTEEQLSAVPDNDGRPDWKAGFKNLRKRSDWREEYAVMMELCCHCSCIYWQGGNHPCSNNTLKEKEKPEMNRAKEIIRLPLDPKDFMELTIVL